MQDVPSKVDTGRRTKDEGRRTMGVGATGDFVLGVTLSKLATKKQYVINAIGRVRELVLG